MTSKDKSIGYESILGTRVNAVTLSEATSLLEDWAAQRKTGYVCPATVYSVMTALKDDAYRKLVNGSLLTIPDGMPLVWFLRLQGHKLNRVHGPDLMLSVCQRSPGNSIRHFLLGGAVGQAEDVSEVLKNTYHGIEIVGSISTPKDSWSESDNLSAVAKIQASGANLIWVGMGTPWQDEWAVNFSPQIQAPVVGVGSAFDFISGQVKWAPKWIQYTGFQWLYRLIREPRRLWRRYLFNNPAFVFLVILQLLGIRKYPL